MTHSRTRPRVNTPQNRDPENPLKIQQTKQTPNNRVILHDSISTSTVTLLLQIYMLRLIMCPPQNQGYRCNPKLYPYTTVHHVLQAARLKLAAPPRLLQQGGNISAPTA